MMPKITFFIIVCLIFVYFLLPKTTFAAENPLAVANNKIGIHILSTSELSNAARLVNSNGGEWGYVLIPIQTGDKDVAKWQTFMNECKRNRVIPIIRLATESDTINTHVWRKPNPFDIVDFANFLAALDWPTKNRYIIVFNEVNRADEWGGNANPHEYAELLSFAITVFKSKSSDFFLINAGLDNAAPDQGNVFINQYTYLSQMHAAVPGIFNQLDGIASHSYPNPGFSQPPTMNNPKGVASFMYERELIKQLSNKTLPVFITETGWSSETVTEDIRVKYYDETFRTIWNDSGIVAITPFLLQASVGPFEKFSFVTANGYLTKQYKFIESLPKVKGIPSSPTTNVLPNKPIKKVLGIKDFSDYSVPKRSFSLVDAATNFFNLVIGK